MRLAALAGLKVAAVRLTRASGKDVLLIERFDREEKSSGWSRKAMVSALTIFGLDEMMARYASYETLADTIRARFTDASRTLRELFGRLTFNILVGNTDDDARNHATFWDGEDLTLTPAYDICPQTRSGREASQAMLIYQNNRESRLDVCLQAAGRYLLSEAEAVEIIKGQVAHILENWRIVCDEAELSQVDRNLLWRRQFLNNLAFEGSEDLFADLLRKLN
jgi:serine/threonine-protein kinase HipA